MKNICLFCCCIGLAATSNSLFGAPPACEPTLQRHALHIGAERPTDFPQDWFSRLLRADIEISIKPAEIYGRRIFKQILPNQWIFVLLRQKHGWVLRVYDKYQYEGGVDMTSITPPYFGNTPNTRDLFGWHFRNQQNTGPNQGDVNAPQHLRPFAFSTSLAGTGGFKPSTNSSELRFTEPQGEGRGWLFIHEMGLTDLAAGERANMNYLKFEACLTWPKTEEEQIDERGQASLDYLPEEIENFGACGLDLLSHQLEARVLPRYLSGDFDGDDAGDEFAQIIRMSDGDRDLVLCRAGTWHQLIKPNIKDNDTLLTINSLGKWQLVPKDFAEAGSPGGDTFWPDADGDVLVIERVEKSMDLVFWRNNKLHTQKVYRYVEP